MFIHVNDMLGVSLDDAVTGLVDDVCAVVRSTQPAVAEMLRERVFGSPVIALVGRVSSGKSTLVNALVGQEIAPTDHRECTRVATLYKYGVPERVDVVGLDGTTSRAANLNSRDLGRPPEEVDYEVVQVAQAHLRDSYRLIDTPGLSGHTSTAGVATRRALLESRGLPRPDVVLFLIEGGQLRTDEVEFLNHLGASPLNTILVCAQADLAGEGVAGDVDPFDTAALQAEGLAREYPRFSHHVLPVSGLMAESAELTLSEREAAELRSLAGADAEELLFGVHAGEVPESVSALIDRIGLYGLLRGRDVARGGAQALSDWLRERSGLGALREAIDVVCAQAHSVNRARAAVSNVREIAAQNPDEAQIGALLERFELDPSAQRLRELSALDRLRRREPNSPVIQQLGAVAIAGTWAGVCGLDESTSSEQVQERARDLIGECRSQRMQVFASAETEALTVLERTYQLAADGYPR